MNEFNRTKFVEGLRTVAHGLNIICDSFEAQSLISPAPAEKVTETPAPAVETEKVIPITSAPEKVSKTPVAPSVEETPVDTSVDFRSMKYNDFKKYAASLGVDCKGTRREIEERVTAVLNTMPSAGSSNDVPEKETPVETTSKKETADTSSAPTSRKKAATKKSAPVEETDEYDELAKELTSTANGVTEAIKALADAGIRATKRNVTAKLAEALRTSVIVLEDDDEEEETSEEFTAESYFEDFDPDGFNDPDSMTEERLSAVVAKVSNILSDINKGKLTVKDMKDFLTDFLTDDEADLLGDNPDDEDVTKCYIEMAKRIIDDEGNEAEPSEPYALNGVNFCCGHPLSYAENTGRFICSICGEEYEADEDEDEE